ncbi:MAG: hypothetical protein ABL983_13980 [Nitrospira sp.]
MRERREWVVGRAKVAALYAQYWAFHLAFDIIPIGALDALEQDRQVIRRYKKLSGRKDACQ